MKNNYKYYIAMVITTVLFAGAFIAGKFGISSFSPVVLTYLRIGLATVIIFPIMMLKEKENWKLKKDEIFISFKLGLIGMTFYHFFFFTALQYTTASNASVINASMPVITAILASFMLKEKLSAKKIVLILIAFLGVILTITKWNFIDIYNNGFNKGDLIMLCATTSWSVYGILVKKGIKNTSPLKMTTYSFLMCTLIMTPFAFKEIVFDGALNVPAHAYLAILYMAIFPTVIGYTVQQACIKQLGPSQAALFVNLVPVFSIIMALIFLKEAIYPLTFVSAGMIIGSVIMFTKIKD